VNDLDVSPAVFEKVADMDLGRVLVEWSWLENSPVASSQS
jgi:expansin (peptidoglycan-binding protein)